MKGRVLRGQWFYCDDDAARQFVWFQAVTALVARAIEDERIDVVDLGPSGSDAFTELKVRYGFVTVKESLIVLDCQDSLGTIVSIIRSATDSSLWRTGRVWPNMRGRSTFRWARGRVSSSRDGLHPLAFERQQQLAPRAFQMRQARLPNKAAGSSSLFDVRPRRRCRASAALMQAVSVVRWDHL